MNQDESLTVRPPVRSVDLRTAARALKVAPREPSSPGRALAPSQPLPARSARRLGESCPVPAPIRAEPDVAEAEREFLGAMERYKKESGRQFPTWSEILEVLLGLGYIKKTGP